MKLDIFFSICQTEVDGETPSEKVMFQNFFDQVKLADDLGFGTAWVAETHLSCQTQKENPMAVIPEFKGEIGLNTDILQLATKVFSQTKTINVGSAIRNIICNGGPLAHAEAIKTFLTLHDLDPSESRRLNIGFAAGRFPFSNIPYGYVPRNKTEEIAWPVVKGKIFMEAVEVFMRTLKGECLSSEDVTPKVMTRKNFRTDAHWEQTVAAYKEENSVEGEVTEIKLESTWKFPKVGVIPFEANLKHLDLTIGSHDPASQKLANEILPCGVFNLSITPAVMIDETHQRMAGQYHKDGGPWTRDLMPRTALIFLNGDEGLSAEEQSAKARVAAENAVSNYWKAMEGTLDQSKVDEAVNNALIGNAAEVAQQIKDKYHPEDRLMLWFDFSCHDNEAIKRSMSCFMKHVAPALKN